MGPKDADIHNVLINSALIYCILSGKTHMKV